MANLGDRTRRQQILQTLIEARGEWLDGPVLATERVGGSEGLRRLRELVAEGYQIEKRHHPNADRDIWQYRIPRGLITTPLRDDVEPVAEGPTLLKFVTLPARIMFGEVAVCPRCRAKTRQYHYDGLEGQRHKDPHVSMKPCVACNGFGMVPNKGPIPMTAPEQMK